MSIITLDKRVKPGTKLLSKKTGHTLTVLTVSERTIFTESTDGSKCDHLINKINKALEDAYYTIVDDEPMTKAEATAFYRKYQYELDLTRAQGGKGIIVDDKLYSTRLEQVQFYDRLYLVCGDHEVEVFSYFVGD